MNAYLCACHGKTRFPSRRAARRRARQIRGQGGPHFNTYRCRCQDSTKANADKCAAYREGRKP